MSWRLALLLLVAVQAAAPAVEITAEPHHHLVFANDQVRVFNAELAPHADTLMHWHHHDYIYVALDATEVNNTVEGKDPVTVKLAAGETRFLAGNFAHISRNLSDHTFRVVIIELLQDEKPRHAPAHWDPANPDADRGLSILQGGTREILWVHDGVRASEFELQPNAAVPSERRAHPLELVALTDADLYLNDPRRHSHRDAAEPVVHFHAGESRWLPNGLHQPIVNAGQGKAKFVTLEFQ